MIIKSTAVTVLAALLSQTAQGFSTGPSSFANRLTTSPVRLASASADVNGVDEAVTSATDGEVPAVNDRYDAIFDEVGLDKSQLKQVQHLPHKRPLSPFDVFCNRELNLGSIGAIGFDMDYTLVQYKQPAFDQLAFDGAKEKLVSALGYPEEVLNFEYDHEVRVDARKQSPQFLVHKTLTTMFFAALGSWFDHRHRTRKFSQN